MWNDSGSGLEYDAEDRLPPGQPLIDTELVKQATAFMTFLMEARTVTGYSTMGLLTGGSGWGKSIAAQAFMDSLPRQPHTGGPACLKVKVQHRSSALALAQSMLNGLRVQHAHHNVYHLADEVAVAIVRHDLALMIIDEADRLTADSFELLRHVYDRCWCPFVIVGLPAIMNVIRQSEKFSNRVGMYLDLPPLTLEQVLDVVLPRLQLPYWVFDPSNAQDRALGRWLWERTGPDLRKLRTVLQISSGFAHTQRLQRITAQLVTDALRFNTPPTQSVDLRPSPIATPSSPGDEAPAAAAAPSPPPHAPAPTPAPDPPQGAGPTAPTSGPLGSEAGSRISHGPGTTGDGETERTDLTPPAASSMQMPTEQQTSQGTPPRVERQRPSRNRAISASQSPRPQRAAGDTPAGRPPDRPGKLMRGRSTASTARNS